VAAHVERPQRTHEVTAPGLVQGADDGLRLHAEFTGHSDEPHAALDGVLGGLDGHGCRTPPLPLRTTRATLDGLRGAVLASPHAEALAVAVGLALAHGDEGAVSTDDGSVRSNGCMVGQELVLAT